MDNEEQIIDSQLVEGVATEAGAGAALGMLAARFQNVYTGPRRRVVAIEGKLHVIDEDRPTREHKAGSVDAVVAHATEHSAVWHDGDTVVLVLDNRDDSHRDDRVTWSLTKTEAWSNAASKHPAASQKALISRLTGPLRKPVRESPTATSLLDAVRAMKFSTTDDETGTHDHGKSSMGRQINSNAAGAGAIPEEVVLGVRRWAELDYIGSLELVVGLDAENRQFNVQPTTDEAAAAEQAAQAALAVYLREALDAAGKKEAKVYAGRP